jgi:hypothetical protein
MKVSPAKSKKSKPAPVKTCDETPRLNARQAAYLKGLAELKTKKQGGLAAWLPALASSFSRHAFDSLISLISLIV